MQRLKLVAKPEIYWRITIEKENEVRMQLRNLEHYNLQKIIATLNKFDIQYNQTLIELFHVRTLENLIELSIRSLVITNYWESSWILRSWLKFFFGFFRFINFIEFFVSELVLFFREVVICQLIEWFHLVHLLKV